MAAITYFATSGRFVVHDTLSNASASGWRRIIPQRAARVLKNLFFHGWDM
jgi:hypothetical protein